MISKFEQALKSTMNDEISVTENGACGFKTTGHKLLDINFAVSSLRNKSKEEIIKMFSEAYYENPLLAVKWLFMLRDIRGTGMGERRSFRICFTWLANTRPDIAKKLVGLTTEYGRWDDLFCLFGTPVEETVIECIDAQWALDIHDMKEGKSISLLAKWMPSINTSSYNTVLLAKKLAKVLDLSERTYRKTLSQMRKYLKVVEVSMSAKNWNEINYEAVPSKANVKYNSAFLRNDETRRREFLGKLERGEAKINSSANFPSDIVHAYVKHVGWCCRDITKDPALEALWTALPNYIKNQETGSTIVVADGSGSMTSSAGGTSMSCLDVANSLAIYFAEKLTGPFKDKYITFSERPQYVDFTNCKSLAEKLQVAYQHNECANTNVEAVFDLILETAVSNHLEQKDLPSNIVIISDMSFDQGTSWRYNTSYWNNAARYSAQRNALFTSIQEKYVNVGYKMPRLVFWNVNAHIEAIPLQQNDMGVALVSGYSPAIANMVFFAKLDPYEVLVDALNAPRYQTVENLIKDII